MPAQWTLNARNTNGNFGQLLAGCHIVKNSTDTGYNFTEPNVNNVLASSPGSSLPTTSFTFPAFDWNGLTGCSINMDGPVAAGTNWGGFWSSTGSPPPPIHHLPTGPQSGDFVAQAGSGLEEDEGASSAKA